MRKSWVYSDLCFLAVLLGFTYFLQAQSQGAADSTNTGAVIGMVDDGKPYQGAQVDIQHFMDKNCARLFGKRSSSRKDIQKLGGCAPESSVFTDKNGNYRFANLEPGLYAIHVLFYMTHYPGSAIMAKYEHPLACKIGDWEVAYSLWKDKSGHYNGMAQQARIFELKVGEEHRVDFFYHDELANEKFLSEHKCDLRRPPLSSGMDSSTRSIQMPSPDPK